MANANRKQIRIKNWWLTGHSLSSSPAMHRAANATVVHLDDVFLIHVLPAANQRIVDADLAGTAPQQRGINCSQTLPRDGEHGTRSWNWSSYTGARPDKTVDRGREYLQETLMLTSPNSFSITAMRLPARQTSHGNKKNLSLALH